MKYKKNLCFNVFYKNDIKVEGFMIGFVNYVFYILCVWT